MMQLSPVLRWTMASTAVGALALSLAGARAQQPAPPAVAIDADDMGVW